MNVGCVGLMKEVYISNKLNTSIMKNIFVITLGTRDVQLRKSKLIDHGFVVSFDEKQITHPDIPGMKLVVYKNRPFPNYYCFVEPRNSGEIILEYWDYLKSVVEFPLIWPAWESITSNYKIDDIVIVYTNQRNLDLQNKSVHFNNDTISFRMILRQTLQEMYPELPSSPKSDVEVTEFGANIDHQYRTFAVTCRMLFEQEPEIENVFLLAQGGMDQINHALTLQLIQAFRSKVTLWQQAEGEEPQKLEFPFLFIEDLNKQKIIEHLENFNFNLIDDAITSNRYILDLASYAFAKLNINYKDIPPSIPLNLIEESTVEIQCKDLYLSAKINKKNLDFGNYLWKMFSLLENLYRIKCVKYFGEKNYFNSKYDDSRIVNVEWINILKSIKSDKDAVYPNCSLYDFLRNTKVGKGNLKFNNPNRLLYKYAYHWFVENKKDFGQSEETVTILKKISKILTDFAEKRNSIAHNLEPLNIRDIDAIFGIGKLEKVELLLDNFFKIKCQYDIYEIIRNEITLELNKNKEVTI
jgi:hypothetical protein